METVYSSEKLSGGRFNEVLTILMMSRGNEDSHFNVVVSHMITISILIMFYGENSPNYQFIRKCILY